MALEEELLVEICVRLSIQIVGKRLLKVYLYITLIMK